MGGLHVVTVSTYIQTGNYTLCHRQEPYICMYVDVVVIPYCWAALSISAYLPVPSKCCYAAATTCCIPPRPVPYSAVYRLFSWAHACLSISFEAILKLAHITVQCHRAKPVTTSLSRPNSSSMVVPW